MLNDLIFVLRQIKTVIEEYNLPDLYANFANTLQQISEASTDELQVQLKEHKSRIKEAHEKLEPEGWSYSQLNVFDRFGARGLIGKACYLNFQKALSENAANTPGAVEELNRQQQQITQLLTNTNNILTSLGPLAQEKKLSEDTALVQIVFDEGVQIDNLPQLASKSKEWKEIIRAFSMLAGESPEKTTILAVSKDSPLSIWLATLPLISKAIYHTVKPLLDLWKQVLEGREHALALKKMEIEIDNDRFELFAKIDAFARKRVKETMEEVAKTYRPNELPDAQFNEAKNALLKAGEDLFGFITNGGKVDANKDGKNNNELGNFQLEAEYQHVHELKDNLQKMLPEGLEEENGKGTNAKEEKKRGRPKKSNASDTLSSQDNKTSNNK